MLQIGPSSEKGVEGAICDSKVKKNLYTPARTLSISRLKSRVLKLPFFNLKMMMKNVLDFFC